MPSKTEGCNKGFATKYKYQLKIRNAGTYTSKTIAGLLWEVVKHRWYVSSAAKPKKEQGDIK